MDKPRYRDRFVVGVVIGALYGPIGPMVMLPWALFHPSSFENRVLGDVIPSGDVSQARLSDFTSAGG